MSASDIIITVENLSKRYKLGTIGATSLRESVERGWHRLRGRDWRAEMGKVGHGGKVESRSSFAKATADKKQKAEIETAGQGAVDGGELTQASPMATPDAAVESGQSAPNLQPSTSNLQPSSNDLWALKDVSFEVKRGECLGLIGRNGCGKTTLLRLIAGIFPPDQGEIAIRVRVIRNLESRKQKWYNSSGCSPWSAVFSKRAGVHPYMTGARMSTRMGRLISFVFDR